MNACGYHQPCRCGRVRRLPPGLPRGAWSEAWRGGLKMRAQGSPQGARKGGVTERVALCAVPARCCRCNSYSIDGEHNLFDKLWRAKRGTSFVNHAVLQSQLLKHIEKTARRG